MTHYLELLWPLMSSPMLHAMLRRKPRKCGKRKRICRHLPESVGRVLPPLQYRRY